jgi:8-oxo-dGTP pyrophosphatase MutT (NUDIX family)
MTDSRTPARASPTAFSAGVVVVHWHNDGWRLLVLRAYRNWDFPKGMLEPNETPLAAAIRETAEETSITDLDFRWGEAFCETAPYGKGKVARYYLAETKQENIILPVSPELGRPEHDEWRWIGLDEAENLLPPRLQPVLAWARTLLKA